MLVKLTYFRASGKYYSGAEYNTGLTPTDELGVVWHEVAQMLHMEKLPGLCDGAIEFLILIDVPEHPHNHPRLIMPDHWRQMLMALEA